MKIGYAMYSARDLTRDPKSMRSTLKALADMGYDGVEFFVYAGTKPEELREMVEEFGLEAIGAHVHKPRWDADTEGEIQYAVKAGIPCRRTGQRNFTGDCPGTWMGWPGDAGRTAYGCCTTIMILSLKPWAGAGSWIIFWKRERNLPLRWTPSGQGTRGSMLQIILESWETGFP